jgi:peroxiredoxin
MAGFIQNFKFVQSADGKTGTFTDLSTWTSNDENYTRALFTRTVVLVDAFGDEISSHVIPANTDVFTIDLTKDLWIEVQGTYDEIDGSGHFEKTIKVPLRRFFIIAFKKKVRFAKDNKSTLESLSHALVFIKAADDAIPVGDGVEYQENIDAAYSFIIPC